MRHDSERVPGKNYRPFSDGDRCSSTSRRLAGCQQIDAIVIDTDSPTIQEQCAASFPDVIVHRPARAPALGHVPMNDVLRYDTEQVPSAWYLQTHSTNPLLEREPSGGRSTPSSRTYPEHDSLFWVTRLQTRLIEADGEAVNHDPEVLARTQDLPPLYEENSVLYLFDREGFRRRRTDR